MNFLKPKQHTKISTPHLSAIQSGMFAVIILISFSSCLGPKKMDKWIDNHYKSTAATKAKNSDYISIKTETTSSPTSTTQRGKKKLIPALLFWHWDYSTVSTLHSSVPVRNINASLLPYANTKGLKQKLNGQKLELSVVKAPAAFELTEKGNLIFLGVWYVGWETIYIEPEKQDLVVSYRILKDGAETGKGEISILNRDQPISLKMMQSPKKMTLRYLDQYNANIKYMSKELVDKLLIEVQQQGNFAQK